MAERFTTIAEDDLSCPVCFMLLRDPNTPKELDCSHVCCAECIAKMAAGKGGTIECPECRGLTRIPQNGVTAMKTAYRLSSLAEKHHTHTAKTADTSETGNKKPVRQEGQSMCQEHNIAIDFFCTKCDVIACSSCMLYRHQGAEHEVVEVTAALRGQKEQMKPLLSRLSAEITVCADGIQQLHTHEQRLVRESTEQKESIDKHAEKIVARVRESSRLLKERFDSIEQPRIERIQKEKARLQNHLVTMKDMETSVQNAMSTLDKRDYVRQHQVLLQNVVDEVVKDHDASEHVDPMIGKARVRLFERPDVKLGTLLEVNHCQLNCVQELDCKGNRSVAVTTGGLRIVTIVSKSLCVYQRQSNAQYKKETTIALSTKHTTEQPLCVAVTSEDKYLVVRDGVCIEIYMPWGQYAGIVDLKPSSHGKGADIGENIKPCWLVVEEDDGLLVADYDHKIIRFSRNGVFQQSAKTSIAAYNITALPNGKVAGTNMFENRLFIVDTKSGAGLLKMDVPQANAVCYHEQTDTVMVGRCLQRSVDGKPDVATGVIEQYCPTTGELVRRIFDGSSLSCPRDMVITDDGMLILADEFYIRIFSIRNITRK